MRHMLMILLKSSLCLTVIHANINILFLNNFSGLKTTNIGRNMLPANKLTII